MGSCNYVSPEQASGSGTLDLRSDIFSIGAVAYELLCYRQAFSGGPPGVLHKIISAVPEPLLEAYAASEALVPGEERSLDPEIERIVLRALEKDPSQRYQDVAAMRQDVEDVRRRVMWATGAREERVPTSAPHVERPQVPVSLVAAPVTTTAPSSQIDVAHVATVPTPRLPQTVVAVVQTIESPAAGVPTVEKPNQGPARIERRIWRPRMLLAVGALVLAIGASAIYGRGLFSWLRTGTSVGTANNAQVAPTPEAEHWAKAVKTQDPEDYEAYLRFLKEKGIAGDHKVEAQTRLATLWSPVVAPAFRAAERGSVFLPKGFRGKGCAEPTRNATQWSAEGKVVVYWAQRECRPATSKPVAPPASQRGLYGLYAEVEGQPPLELESDYRGLRVMSGDGRWVALISRTRGLIVVNTDNRQTITLATLNGGFGDYADYANRILISDDGSVVAVGTREGSVAVFSRETAERESLPWMADEQAESLRVALSSVSRNGRFIVVSIRTSGARRGQPPSKRWPSGFYVYDRQRQQVNQVTSDSDSVFANYSDTGVITSSVLVSNTGDWVVFLSESGTLSLLREAPPGTDLHFYARQVRTGRTWLVHSGSKVPSATGISTGMRYSLFDQDLLALAANGLTPPGGSASSASASPTENAAMMWMTLPNGRVSTHASQLQSILGWGMGSERKCALMADQRILCPVQ
jgi:hypothetical protein